MKGTIIAFILMFFAACIMLGLVICFMFDWGVTW